MICTCHHKHNNTGTYKSNNKLTSAGSVSKVQRRNILGDLFLLDHEWHISSAKSKGLLSSEKVFYHQYHFTFFLLFKNTLPPLIQESSKQQQKWEQQLGSKDERISCTAWTFSHSLPFLSPVLHIGFSKQSPVFLHCKKWGANSS